MTSLVIMISLIVAVFISVMLLALVIQLKPGWLRITEKIVCRKGSRLIIFTFCLPASLVLVNLIINTVKIETQ